MPPKGKLPDKDIATLEKWVKDGLPVSADRLGDVAKVAPKSVVTEEAKKYWAYQPVKRPAVPEVKDKAWVEVADRRVRPREARSEGAEAGQARGARRRSSGARTTTSPACRRRPKRSTRSSTTTSPDAYEKLIDKLLASPHYGEKWGRHWLDVVRYAETNGYERDGPKPFAWRYRDYVIQSFNADKPYDAVHQGAARGRRDARRQPGRGHRHRVLPPRHLGRRAGRPAPGGVRRLRRHRRDRGAGVPRRRRSTAPAATTTRSIRSRRPTTTSWSRSSATSGRTPKPATCGRRSTSPTSPRPSSGRSTRRN